MSERRGIRRQKSFLHGFIYFDKNRGTMSCLIRDLSDDGARIIFSEMVTIPEHVNLHIPQRDKSVRARVQWRRGDEIGLSFEATPVTAVSAQESDLMQQIVQLETEITELKGIIKKLKRGKLEDEVEAA